MSTNPYWRPIIPDQGHVLPKDVKYALSRKYFNHDGSLSGSTSLTDSDIPFLEGVIAGTNNPDVKRGVKTLIDAIRQYDAVEFFLIG